MPRLREFDVDVLLDHARRLWVREGVAGVTVRALAAQSGVSNGSIYHAFGSRATLLAQVWIRQADEFLLFQREIARDARETYSPQDLVVAVALAPTTYAEIDVEGARLLLDVRPDDLYRDDVADDQRKELRRLRRDLTNLITDLAAHAWDRTDATALATMRLCVVDLPGRLLLSTKRASDVVARHALEVAVRGIAATDPPQARRPPSPRTR